MLIDIAYPTYDENETRIIDDLDCIFLSFAKGYKVNQWSFASLIGNDIIKKCGYFESMPTNLSFVSDVRNENVSIILNEGLITSLPISEYSLTPAACLHIYPMLQKTRKYNELITTRQKVYRHEQGQYDNETRLWEFWVREFVAVGSEKYVKEFLKDFQTKALGFATSKFKEAYLRSANDFFYPSRENKIIQRIQSKNNMKQELVINVGQKEVACASFNYHKNHFSRIFDFDEGGKVVTGCVGFGLNRWYARCLGNEKII